MEVINIYGIAKVTVVEICGKLGRLNRRPGAESVPGVYTLFPRAEKGRGEVAGMRACSACAGDYEDPDRTAWTPDDADDEDDEEREEAPAADGEEFPAGK
jgi:hypothetical protein